MGVCVKYLGPHEVVCCINPTVKLKLPKVLKNIHPVFHFSLLKKNPGPCTLCPLELSPQVIMVDGEDHHEDAKILNSKIKHKTLYYPVKWTAFPFLESEWDRAHEIHAPRLVAKGARMFAGPILYNSE